VGYARTVRSDGPTHGAATLTADRVLALLSRRDVALARHHSAVARRLAVSGTELLALRHLAREGDLSPAALAELLDLSSGGVAALVQRLAAAGHVRRHRPRGELRGTQLRVTPTTAAVLRAAEAPLHAALDALARDLTSEQQATVGAWLRTLAERCEQITVAERATAHPRGA
jgi:DNA-binding MarR family transcriptional regulator